MGPLRGERAVDRALSSIMVIEVRNSGILWTEPKDVSLDEIKTRLLDKHGTDEINFVTTGGRVGTLTRGAIVFRGSEVDLISAWAPHAGHPAHTESE